MKGEGTMTLRTDSPEGKALLSRGAEAALRNWLISGHTGVSSLTIAHVLSRTASPRYGAHVPLDPSDFGRCLGLLTAVPEFAGRLKEVAAKYPEWAPLVREWDNLKELYYEELPYGTAPKLYERMQDLIEEGRA